MTALSLRPTIRERVLRLRLLLRLSQEAFARRLGYSVGSISKWETGRYPPGRHAQEALASLERRTRRKRKAPMHLSEGEKST